METLSDLKDYLREELSPLFGEGQFKVTDGSSIADGFFVRTNFTPKSEWANGIWENGLCSTISIMPVTRWEKDCGGCYNMVQIRSYRITKKLRAKNDSNLKAIGKAIVKWHKDMVTNI